MLCHMPENEPAPGPPTRKHPLTGMRSPRRIGRGLKTARRASGLSQAEVAAGAGVSREALSRLESGQHAARTDTLTAALDVLGYELAFLPRSPQAQRLRDRAKGTDGR